MSRFNSGICSACGDEPICKGIYQGHEIKYIVGEKCLKILQHTMQFPSALIDPGEWKP